MMLLKQVFVCILIAYFAVLALPQPRPTTPALESLDPVLLTEGKETPGEASLSLQHGRFLYYFASKETRARFQADPERYGIQLDGACARMGPPTGGSPDAYFVYKGRIYVFGSQDCYKRFSEAPEKYLESAHPAEWKPTAESRTRGQALLKRAVEGIGGAARLDAVKGYVDSRKSTSMSGREMEITRVALLPNSFRNETKSGDMAFGSLITPAGALALFREEGARVPASFGRAMASDWRHELVPLLRARSNPGFAAYASGASELRVKYDGVVSTLHIDPATGRVTAVSYIGRGPEGVLGDIRASFSDYRDVNGLQLPFHVDFAFEGKPDARRGFTLDSWKINPPDLDSRLKPPAKITER
jgi:YHS domain-containing protein